MTVIHICNDRGNAPFPSFGDHPEKELRICKNCKWWDMVDELDIGECLTVNYCHSYEDAVFKPQEDFGCNQWEKKD